MITDRWFRTLLMSGALLSFAACGGGASNSLTPRTHAPAPAKAKTAAQLRITIPHASTGASRSRIRPAYLSTATQSAIIDVMPQGSSTSIDGYPQTVDLTPTSTGCTSSLASTLCLLTLALPPANYNVTISTFDQTGGIGNVLSAAQSVPFTVSLDALNLIALTLGGIPASAEFFPVSRTLTGSRIGGFALITNATAKVMVLALDAAGNVIVGAGAPTISVASSNSEQVSITQPTIAMPNTITLASIAQTTPVTLTATVTPTVISGASAVTASAIVAPSPELHLYVTNVNAGHGTVTGYDQNGNQQTLSGSFPNLNFPSGIAYHPANGFLYVANSNNGTITAYDLNGNQQTLSGSFPNLNAAVAIAYHPANGFLYVTNNNNNTVTVYDQNGNQQILSGSFLGVNYQRGSIAYDPANRFLYMANIGNDTVTAYDQNGNQQTLSGSFLNLNGLEADGGIAYDPDNSFLYVVQGNTIKAYDQNGNPQTLSGSFPNLAAPRAIVYDPDNGFLYVVNQGTNIITVYDQNGNQQTLSGSFPGMSQPTSITIAP